MNCKPGDLAIVVWSEAGNEGKILRCLRLVRKSVLMKNFEVKEDWCWEIDRQIPGCHGTPTRFVRDSILRPIRDPGDDAVDETLLRLPSPRQEVTA
jgi:hypothetical protein